ncbi:hydrogen peroxide-inducible genes activator [Litoreibacter janthinus]|uniref:LysR family transcriptional regulator, hydrogen peroxide-inducible genes activator n=1 Tax=Litoreibacter janthinus TaxID=670154 RepID=A0A1I6HCX3_9RHOB|nr:hydrogen peroxide-inducible genes activator [Litoreibacter janthinus]SFR52137.1 LysR family transcriptional regulator, hydrogen peroxide-inducible genes activator [Litoreibacter janthinus]
MSQITLKHLRYFEALAHHGHFGRAADVCAISQPALSVQMQELERILGAPLIERGARRIRLTRLGEEFSARAREVLRSVDELSDLARASRNDLSGPFRIGIIPTIAPYLLPAFVKRLSLRHPDLDPHPREAVTQTLIDELLDGRIDAAIVALPVSEPSLTEVALFEEDFVLVRSEEDAGKPVPSSDKLREMRLLLLEEGHCFRDQAISYCNLSSSLPRDLMEASSLSTLVQMVGAGIGVTLIPEMAVRIETRSAAVSIAHLPNPQPSRTVGMVWRNTNPLAEHLTAIAELFREVGVDAA